MHPCAINLTSLYTSEQGRLSRLVHRIVRNRCTPEDLVQETFVNLLKLPGETDIADPRAYLARVARNLAIDHRRYQSMWAFVDDGEAELFTLADPSPSPETVVADRHTLALTLRAIEALPERTRRAFEMHRLGEHRLAEIARVLEISTSLTGRLVQEGYAAVLDRLSDEGGV